VKCSKEKQGEHSWKTCLYHWLLFYDLNVQFPTEFSLNQFVQKHFVTFHLSSDLFHVTYDTRHDNIQYLNEHVPERYDDLRHTTRSTFGSFIFSFFIETHVNLTTSKHAIHGGDNIKKWYEFFIGLLFSYIFFLKIFPKIINFDINLDNLTWFMVAALNHVKFSSAIINHVKLSKLMSKFYNFKRIQNVT